MNKNSKSSLLASFATIKCLAEEKKYRSMYQLLAEFIRYIINENSMHTFNASKIKRLLHEQFGFEIPESVIKTSLRGMSGIELRDRIYEVNQAELGSDSLFEEKKKENDDTNNDIIASIILYIKQKDQSITVDEENLTQELIAYLVEEKSKQCTKYSNLISEYIIKNEENESVQIALNRIREGSLLYLGINHNIYETGSITKPLTLYLGTEILFSLIGYNGDLHKQLALDFYNQVCVANAGGKKKIILRYFREVKEEIDDYFYSAAKIVEGSRVSSFDKPAMIAITENCRTSSEVMIKKADFYHLIQYNYSIIEDEVSDYYCEELSQYNLESFDYYDADDIQKKKENGIKFVSHINKLRRGRRFVNDIDSEYLLITNTKATLQISKEQTDRICCNEGKEYTSNFAVSLDRITSLLWYKLGNGFGQKEYPKNASAVLKARVVLSSEIAKNVERSFNEAKKEYEEGMITDEQLASRIITLRSKPILPEALNADSIDEVLDFSPQFLSQYEERVISDRNKLAEKDKIIQSIQESRSKDLQLKDEQIQSQEKIIAANQETIMERDKTIAQQMKNLGIKENENRDLRKTIEDLQKQVTTENERREQRQKRLDFIRRIVTIIIITVIVAAISYGVVRYLSPDYANTAALFVSILGLVVAVWQGAKKDDSKTK